MSALIERAICSSASLATTNAYDAIRLERQWPRLLHLRQCAHLGEHLRRQHAVDLDQRNGIAAGRLASDMERRDVDTGVSQRRRELADEARLVQIGDVNHRRAELGIHADALDVDD